jgi:4-amino-4-deoxy-L-arabinose transferase-like glycosyltransferase
MHRLRRIFAAVAVVFVLSPLIASAPLFDPDEGLHAAIAQEMVTRGDYVTPTFLGEPFLDKPILFFWAEAASLRVIGDTEAAVRLPPLLFGLAGMLSIALLGRLLFGEAAGLIAGIVYATMLMPLGVSQVAVHDVGLIPFMCVAAWCVAAVALPPRSGPARTAGFALIAGVCLGLSILTKGLAGVVFTGIFAVCLAVHRRASIVRIGVMLTLAGVIAALVAAPWYVAMEHAHPGYLHYYFVERHLQGYLTATQRHAGRPFLYYVPIVLGGALPWTLYLAEAMRSRRQPLQLVVWGWFALGLLFLSLGESKLLTYALPLFPALALLAGDIVSRDDPAARGRWFRAAFGVHAALLTLLPAFGLLALRWKYGASYPQAWPIVAAAGLGSAYAASRAVRSRAEYGFVSWMAAAAIATLCGMTVVVPRAADWTTSRDLAQALNAAGTLPPRVSVLDERIGSLVFYLSPALRATATRGQLDDASLAEAISRLRVEPDNAIVAVRNGQLARFNRLFPQPPKPDGQAGTFTFFRAITLRETLQRR